MHARRLENSPERTGTQWSMLLGAKAAVQALAFMQVFFSLAEPERVMLLMAH